MERNLWLNMILLHYFIDEGGCGFDNGRGGKGASGAGSVNHSRYDYYYNSDYSLLSCLGQTSIRLYTLF